MIPIKHYIKFPLFEFPPTLYSYNPDVFLKMDILDILKNSNHAVILYNSLDVDYSNIIKKYERKGIVLLILCAADRTFYSLPYIGSNNVINALYKKYNKPIPKRVHCGNTQKDYAYSNNIKASYKCYKRIFNNKKKYIKELPSFEPLYKKNRDLDWVLSKKASVYMIIGPSKTGRTYLANKISEKYNGKIITKYTKKSRDKILQPFSLGIPVIIDTKLDTIDKRMQFLDLFRNYKIDIMLIMVNLSLNMRKYMSHLNINSDTSGVLKFSMPRKQTIEPLESMKSELIKNYKCRFIIGYYFPSIANEYLF